MSEQSGLLLVFASGIRVPGYPTVILIPGSKITTRFPPFGLVFFFFFFFLRSATYGTLTEYMAFIEMKKISKQTRT